MAKFFRYVVASLLICLLVPVAASAHVLESDGSIGAVLHINPDDDPHAGVVTSYVLAFNDSDQKFSLPKCDCNVSVIENNVTLKTMPLAQTSDQESDDTFTFPKPDIYILQVTGTPKIAGGFQSFKINYTLRVEGGQQVNQQMPLLLWVGLGMAVGLVLLFAYASDTDDGKDNRNKDPKEKK